MFNAITSSDMADGAQLFLRASRSAIYSSVLNHKSPPTAYSRLRATFSTMSSRDIHDSCQSVNNELMLDGDVRNCELA